MKQVDFDRFASTYDQDLAKSLAITGEDRTYYAQARIEWTAWCAARLHFKARRILDYGCGDGWNAPMLAARFKADQVLGVDVSSASIAVASRANYGPGISFFSMHEWTPDGAIDLAFTNGVFHHISPEERQDCLRLIRRSLRPGGLLAFWENNPWNLGTHYVMARCAFDENAVKISPREAKRMLSRAGFKILRTSSLFYFPRLLSLLRPAEAWLRKLPFGGQYLVLSQNPSV